MLPAPVAILRETVSLELFRRAHMTNRFSGFKPEALAFLRELAANNDAAWFKPRKAIYEAEIKAPMARLIAALSDEMQATGLPLAGDPLRSMLRIYRDIRFSRDKRPYKTAASAALTRSGQRHDPGLLYVHVEPGKSFLGCGFWQPPPELLEAWRRDMLRDPARFLKLVRALEKKGVALNGGELRQRLPRGFEAGRGLPIERYLLWSSYVAMRPMPDDALFAADLPERIIAYAQDCRPLLDYGWALMQKPSASIEAEGKRRGASAARSR